MANITKADDGGGSARRVDRAALERVLARAAELQAETGDSEETLTEQQILELGREVGLSPEHLRTALAEEQTRTLSSAGEPARQSKATAVAQRALVGSPRDLLASIDRWMRENESLRIKRQRPERIVWERRVDIAAAVHRAMSGGRDYALTRAFEVSATVVPVDAQHTLVRLEADYAPYRRQVAWAGAGMTGAGIAGSGVVAVLGFAAPVIAIPAILAGGVSFVAVRSAQRRAMERGQVALEQILDQLEQQGPQNAPQSLGSAVARAMSQMARLIDGIAGDGRLSR